MSLPLRIRREGGDRYKIGDEYQFLIYVGVVRAHGMRNEFSLINQLA